MQPSSGPARDAAIVTEPTGLRVAIAHKGFVGLEIETAVAPRTARAPTVGVDAIARMGPVLVELAELDGTAAGERGTAARRRGRCTPR